MSEIITLGAGLIAAYYLKKDYRYMKKIIKDEKFING